MDKQYVEVAKFARSQADRGIAVNGSRGTVAILEVDGELYALEAHCICCGKKIAEGVIDDHAVICNCGWRYDLASGVIGLSRT